MLSLIYIKGIPTAITERKDYVIPNPEKPGQRKLFVILYSAGDLAP